MEEDISSIKSIIDYNTIISEFILKLCQPLSDNFNINYFEYNHISSDGKVFYICTNKNWLEFSLKHKMFDDEEHVKLCSIAKNCNYRYALWNCLDLEKTNLLSKYFDHNIWNGLSINETEDEYFNVYSFATTKENTNINNFFLKNFNIFEHFIAYFKQEIKFLTEKNPYIKATPLISDINRNDNYYNNIEKFLNQTKLKKFEMYINQKRVYLTEKEIYCLYLLSTGKTMKEIANSLAISHRTVESHLNVIKYKTGLLFKNQLISIFENNPIKNLIIKI